jgi:hypothetical protein
MKTARMLGEVWHLMVTLLLVLVCIANHVEGSEVTTCTVDDGDGATSCTALADTAKTGQLCFPDGSCFDTIEEAANKYSKGVNFVSLDEPVHFGDRQQVSGEHWKSTMDVIVKTQQYMQGVFMNDTMKGYREECKCRHELCAFWSAIGTF